MGSEENFIKIPNDKNNLRSILRLCFHCIFQENEIEHLKKEIAIINHLLTVNAIKDLKSDITQVQERAAALKGDNADDLVSEVGKLQQENAKLKHRVAILKRVSNIFLLFYKKEIKFLFYCVHNSFQTFHCYNY